MRVQRKHRAILAATSIALIVVPHGNSGANARDAETTTSGPPTTTAASSEGSLDELVAAAEAEGSLTVYSNSSAVINEALVTAFSEAYSEISIEIPRVVGADMLQRLPAEAAAGSLAADALIVNLEVITELHSQGLLIDLDPAEIPRLDEWPEGHKTELSVNISVQPIVAAVNTDLIDPSLVPESWEDLLDPELQGEILIIDPTGSPTWLAFLDLLAQNYGDDFLEGFDAQEPRAYEGATPTMEALAAGAGMVVAYTTPFQVYNVVEAGAPVEQVELQPTTGSEQNVAITEEANNPNAARLFMHWLMTEEGQTALNGGVTASPLGECCGGMTIPDEYEPLFDVPEARADEILGILGLP